MCSTDNVCEEKKDLDDSGFVPMSCGENTQDESTCGRRVYLLDLSDDVLLYILKHCSARDLKALGFSCSRFGRLVRERSLWRHVEARSDACSKARLKWLLDNALHADTHVLKLAGYARDTDGCMGFVNMTRKEAEQEHKAHVNNDSNTNGRTTIETIRTNIPPWNMGMERHPARLYISAQRTQLPRHRRFPSWPEDGEEGRAGPQRCSGPQFTFNHALLKQLFNQCPHLTTLGLEYCNIDCSITCLGTFPKTLKKLSLRGTKCYNMSYDKSFLFRIQDHLPLLESLDMSECEWMDPATLLPLSKMPALQTLVLQDCCKLSEFVAYASLTSRYGFKTLKSLDLRGSPVGDSEVAALGWLPQLEKLWLSARRAERAEPHAHYADDERAAHAQMHDWEAQEPDCFKQTSNLDTSTEDIESSTGEPNSSITDEEADTDHERSQSKDTKQSESSKDNNDKKGTIRKQPNEGAGDDSGNDGGPFPKRRRTGVAINRGMIRPVTQREISLCLFDEIERACSRIAENIFRNNLNEEGNEEQSDENNAAAPGSGANAVNPNVNVGNLRYHICDEVFRNRDSGNNRNQNSKGNNEHRPGCSNENRENQHRPGCIKNRENQHRPGCSNENRENQHRPGCSKNRENQPDDRPNNEKDDKWLVDCIKIDQLIDDSDVNSGRQNEVIVIASSSRSQNEPSTSKQSDDAQKTPKTPEPQGYVHFRRNQDPVFVNINRGESDENDGNRNDSNNDVNMRDVEKDDGGNKIDDSEKIDDKKIDSDTVDDQKPGPSQKPVNEGASTSNSGQNENKNVPRPRKRVCPIHMNCSPENVQRREPLPPVQYQIEPRHHVLYVGVGSQLNTYRFPRDSSELLQHLNFRPSHVDSSGLVTDFAMRRFGRADGEDVNVIHIGPDGPMMVGQATGSRPDRSSLRFLSVTGYRNITDRSLVHLATAAPNLSFIDFSGTSVTENGVENFKSLRPECDIVFSQFHEKEEK